VPATTNIAKGQCITIDAWILGACTNPPILVTVQGEAIASTNYPCIYDAFGNVIKSLPSTCNASVSCEVAVTCRVTGGGTLYSNTVSHNCIDVGTTIYDSLNSAVVDHISHGGQLGAPFSQMDCGERLNNPCIRGEWSHTRHYDNKQTGLQDGFDMSFHSANPNPTGHFDTLECACLPCCGDTSGFKPAPAGWSNFRFTVCNPDDRRICGPLPRPAPANAIIFTGIGTFTPQDSTSNGRKAAARYVIFRVYIEDRSEPGGAHPGGQNEPVTIYCFQAWDTGVAVVQTKKRADLFSTLQTDFRVALGQASCAFMADMSTGVKPPGSLPDSTVNGVAADVVDCGPLHDGSQQIHPSTSATCTQ